MTQLPLIYFWPLTEQVPLDLDYTDCDRPKYIYSDSRLVGVGDGLLFANAVTTGTTWIAMEMNPTKLTVDVENITFKQKQKPNLFRRTLYKLIGINWEIK